MDTILEIRKASHNTGYDLFSLWSGNGKRFKLVPNPLRNDGLYSNKQSIMMVAKSHAEKRDKIIIDKTSKPVIVVASLNNGGYQMVKICNACLNVWDENSDCPECGSDDWDCQQDKNQFDGGLDDRCN